MNELTIAILTAGWTAAWLEWMFRGDILHLLIRLLPKKWTRDIATDEDMPLMAMTNYELMMAIAGSQSLPRFFRGIFSCPRCMSAHVAGIGSIIALSSGEVTWLVPLTWATGAWLGFKLFGLAWFNDAKHNQNEPKS